MSGSTGGIDGTYPHQRVHREITNSLGQTVRTLTRMDNFAASDAVSATTSLDEFAILGFVITGRADYYLSDGLLKTATDAAGNVTQYEYDHRGNRTRITDALGNETQFSYDSATRCFAPKSSPGPKASC